MLYCNRFLPFVLLSLALAAPVGAQDKAPSTQGKPRPKQDQTAKDRKDKEKEREKNPYVERFEQLDRNKDGYVTLDEWPLDPPSFEVVDRNKDGRLSRTELLTPNEFRRQRVDQRFHELDTNRDGRLSRAERERGGAGLERLDRDRDGFISRPELGDGEDLWNPRATGRDQRRFQILDRDGDRRLSRVELHVPGARFEQLDRNRDGVISPLEWPRR